MATIGIMDSGVGGLSVYREIRSALPSENYIYYADNAFCPYGDKTADFVISRARTVTDFLLSKGAEVVVVACNTATAAAIATLRAEYDIPFIGMEPAIKPAALGTRTDVVGVLATAGTLNGSKYLNIRGLYEDNVRIVERVGQGFVELVEQGELSGPKVEETIRDSLWPILSEGADIVVLGCTHYPFLLPAMRKVASDLGYPATRFIDPAPAVARQLCKVMSERGITTGSGKGSLELVSSGSPSPLQRTINSI